MRWSRLAAVLPLLLLLNGCAGESTADYVARRLDVALPEPVSVTMEDTHGGFHGDGLLHIELVFAPADAPAVEEAVSHHPSGHWNPFPMDGEMEEILYRGGASDAGWPVPRRGWWYLRDRQAGGEGGMLTRSSFNYTFAVYDPEERTLYYQEFDT